MMFIHEEFGARITFHRHTWYTNAKDKHLFTLSRLTLNSEMPLYSWFPFFLACLPVYLHPNLLTCWPVYSTRNIHNTRVLWLVWNLSLSLKVKHNIKLVTTYLVTHRPLLTSISMKQPRSMKKNTHTPEVHIWRLCESFLRVGSVCCVCGSDLRVSWSTLLPL